MFNTFNSIKKSERGFTIAELLVTLIILGTFILLAAPKFINFVAMAEETRIQNDVRVAENLSVLEIYKNGFDLANNENINIEMAKIEEAVLNGKAYDIKGKIKDMNNIGEEEYFQLNQNFIENDLKTNLNGKFLSTNDAKVIYIETQIEETTLQDKATNIKTALFDKVTNNELNADTELFDKIELTDTDEIIESYESLLSSIK